MSSSKANLKIIGDLGCSWCVYANKQAKIKSWTQSSHFNNNEGDLKEKNHGLRKITMLSIGYRNRAAVLEVCFHLEVETGFVTSPKMFNLQA